MGFLSVSSSCRSSPSADRDGSNLSGTTPEEKGRLQTYRAELPQTLEAIEKELTGYTALVETLGIYRTPIEANPTLLHDFIVIELNHARLGTKKNKKVGYIRAEKEKNSKGRGEIVLTYPDEISEGAKEKYLLELDGCGEILWETLIAILRAPAPDYSAMKNNCWKYADETYRRLIKEFSNLSGPEKKGRLQTYLEKLPALRLPADGFRCSFEEVKECCEGAVSAPVPCLTKAVVDAISGSLSAVSAGVGLGSAAALPITSVQWMNIVTAASSNGWTTNVPAVENLQLVRNYLLRSHPVLIPVKHLATGAAANAAPAIPGLAKIAAIFTKIGLKLAKFLVLSAGQMKAILSGVVCAFTSPNVLLICLGIFLGAAFLGLLRGMGLKFLRGALDGLNPDWINVLKKMLFKILRDWKKMLFKILRGDLDGVNPDWKKFGSGASSDTCCPLPVASCECH